MAGEVTSAAKFYEMPRWPGFSRPALLPKLVTQVFRPVLNSRNLSLGLNPSELLSTLLKGGLPIRLHSDVLQAFFKGDTSSLDYSSSGGLRVQGSDSDSGMGA